MTANKKKVDDIGLEKPQNHCVLERVFAPEAKSEAISAKNDTLSDAVAAVQVARIAISKLDAHALAELGPIQSELRAAEAILTRLATSKHA